MRLVAFILLLGICGCAPLPPLCIPPGQAMVTVDMLFGRKIGGRLAVSEEAFREFTAREITPRFPDGLTIIDADGQWRAHPGSAIIREPSKLVMISFHDDPQRRVSINEISDAYKRAFRQQSVLSIVRTACVSF